MMDVRKRLAAVEVRPLGFALSYIAALCVNPSFEETASQPSVPLRDGASHAGNLRRLLPDPSRADFRFVSKIFSSVQYTFERRTPSPSSLHSNSNSLQYSYQGKHWDNACVQTNARAACDALYKLSARPEDPVVLSYSVAIAYTIFSESLSWGPIILYSPADLSRLLPR